MAIKQYVDPITGEVTEYDDGSDWVKDNYTMPDPYTGDSSDVPTVDVNTPYANGTDWSSMFGNNIFSRFLSGTASGQDKALATLGFGIASLASALRNKPPEVKMPVYKEAPVYNRALTAPMFPPQPAPTTSPSGQNIYQPMRGLPLFFNPNPFQFNPTEAAKRYGPTPEEQAAGMVGYQQGLERLYQTLGTQPAIQFGTGVSTVTGATGNDTVTGGQSTVTGGGGQDTVAGASGGSLDDLMMAAGRYLKGPGDGMSDSIEAYIEGGSTGDGQPARLARNEFVIPADVVADLGNGSSDAGAEALYEMMDRIRMARHDTKEQPPAVNVDKILPA
jgi:hypothetical protein